MADSKQSGTRSAGSTQLNLVNSSRLQSLRKQLAAAGNGDAAPPESPPLVKPNPQDDAETAQLRRQVDQRLQEILAGFPSGKRHSLFKIRYGIALDELEQLPVQQVAAILKIRAAKRR